MQVWRIVNDLSVAHDLDAITIPLFFRIPGIGATIDILTDDINRFPHHLFNLFGVQARDLEILHSILMCALLGI
jgi:hypothetical protein